MTMKTFVQHDADGNITAIITEHEDFYEMRKADGHQLIEVDDQFDIKTHKVNLKTKRVEKRLQKALKKSLAKDGQLTDIPDLIEPVIDSNIHGLLKKHLSKKKLKGQ